MRVPSDSWWHNRDQVESFAKSFDKSAQVSAKPWWLPFSKAATTIGRTVYIPADWSIKSAMWVIPHEVAGHVKQFRYAGLGTHPILGIFPGMFLIYVWGVIFPIFLAWGRYRMELHAATKAWEYYLVKKGISVQEAKIRAIDFAKKVGGKEYLYAVPKCWAIWGFKRRVNRVIRECYLGSSESVK